MSTVTESKYISLGILDFMNEGDCRYSFLPYGDYVERVDGLSVYSFIASSIDGSSYCLNGGTLADINSLLPEAISISPDKSVLERDTIYYPISLL
jgi:hypothetical protein